MTAAGLVTPQGRPVRPVEPEPCPKCGSGKRVASGGFGAPHPVCPDCGHEWRDEVWRG